MGSSISCDDSYSQSIGFKSCLYTITSEELYTKNEKLACNKTKKEITFLSDHENSTSEEEDGINDLVVSELGYSLIENLEINGEELACEINRIKEQDSTCNETEVEPLSVDSSVLNELSKCASELVQLYPLPEVEDDMICSVEDKNNYSEQETFTPAQSPSTPTKLLSALKGSRSQGGNHLNARLRVNWAPEVYDPPVTSSSRTVKGTHRHHHRSSRYRKDFNNYKYNKGKSSRGSVNDKKHAHRKSSHNSQTDPRISRLQALGGNKNPGVNSCVKPKIESHDLEVSCNESINMYGGSCYMESLMPVPLHVTKAS